MNNENDIQLERVAATVLLKQLEAKNRQDLLARTVDQQFIQDTCAAWTEPMAKATAKNMLREIRGFVRNEYARAAQDGRLPQELTFGTYQMLHLGDLHWALWCRQQRDPAWAGHTHYMYLRGMIFMLARHGLDHAQHPEPFTPNRGLRRQAAPT